LSHLAVHHIESLICPCLFCYFIKVLLSYQGHLYVTEIAQRLVSLLKHMLKDNTSHR